MDDAILQHHFDEVFYALQDRENFEIFTKMKYTKTPKIKRTFFKIVSPSEVNSTASFDEVGIAGKSPRNYISQNTFKLSPYNSRPSSASTTTVKAHTTIKSPVRPMSPKSMLSRELSLTLSQRPISPGSVIPKTLTPTHIVASSQSQRPGSLNSQSPRQVISRALTPTTRLVRSQSQRPNSSRSVLSKSLSPTKELIRSQSQRPVTSRPQSPEQKLSRSHSPSSRLFLSQSQRPVSPRTHCSEQVISGLRYQTPEKPRASRQVLSRSVSPRPSSRASEIPRPFSRPQSPRPHSPRSKSSEAGFPKKVQSRPISTRSTASSLMYSSLQNCANDILGQCEYCGRYFLGEYLTIHEENCKHADANM